MEGKMSLNLLNCNNFSSRSFAARGIDYVESEIEGVVV